jgi:hypothetical protein
MRGTADEKLDVCFRLMDFNNDGTITVYKLLSMETRTHCCRACFEGRDGPILQKRVYYIRQATVYALDSVTGKLAGQTVIDILL